jgi:hypothetical protein
MIVSLRIHFRHLLEEAKAHPGPWPPQANVASDLYRGHPRANFYNPVFLCLPLPIQYISISVAQEIDDLQVLYAMSERSRCQCLILLHVIVEVFVRLHFLEIS